MTGSSDSTFTLDTALVLAVGKPTATALGKAFGMLTVADLLGHYPRRYVQRGELDPVTGLLPLGEHVTITAEVVSSTQSEMKNRKGWIVSVKIRNGQGMLSLTFFGKTRMDWRTRELAPGVKGIFSGRVSEYNGARQLAHPTYRTFEGEREEAEKDPNNEWLQRALIPIYAATASVSSLILERSIDLVLPHLGDIDDPVPADLRVERGLLGHKQALQLIHRPELPAEWQAARDTLRFTEAWILQAALAQKHTKSRESHTTPRVPEPGGFLERFDAMLPFVLTVDQEIAAAEIAVELSATSPMNRLLQGEVGSGKTIVALRAMLAVAESGGQAALLAPTEVLAGQHLRSITAMLGPDLAAELMPTLLTGKLPAAEKRKALLRVVSGQSRIVIGTHALLSDNVTFFDLGLIIIDEQHRFGVDQRESLRLKGAQPPHVLVLTATPIPRTIAMTVFGDLDVSTIRMLPTGRQGITTVVVPLAEHPDWFWNIWRRIGEELALGRQAFVVCPAIAPKEVEEGAETVPLPPEDAPKALTNVETTLAGLRRAPVLHGYRLEALHGRMTSDEKDQTMRAFAAGEIDVLVATTVIEVGVDVPNASAMVVMDADRFGVSQLHQLRGRVGRGPVPGLCLLVTDAALGGVSRERVDAVQGTLDGFELADLDLRLRREGDVLGDSQSGAHSSLRFLRVAVDREIIESARAAAFALVSGDPDLRTLPALRDAVSRRLDESERTWLSKS
ncbi:ATP-dependent DNA helicase RecG [Cryobacterium psychrophilum]|uniref:Probable DNA 3'-5' helicase RecG n=1 Tax=Cryobacterium psychrophilum TaxID=41988 RepID=A0A4Y8KLT7_9MICO|nr:ATP-dependent DNA helicase RecG [Cryobacterium psychrophilum]TDW31190.1 ATP-dependent DNA helicase RecG [Cryobacterium psychrophilum]TFD78519.1 ATP-dependent DNA helicase RecG [Cryobacterium psychrophilum]